MRFGPVEWHPMTKAVLNVGGGSKDIAIPDRYLDWRHDLLDIDPRSGADVCHDARRLSDLPPGAYDAVYCSHNLEHYYRHEAIEVIRGFAHVLSEEGFAEVIVPDLLSLMERVVKEGLDVEDVVYASPAGPIRVVDVVYGYQADIEQSGNDFFAHKNGFSVKSLVKLMREAGFPCGATQVSNGSITGIFFKKTPTPQISRWLGID
jgi:hypothetical protein